MTVISKTGWVPVHPEHGPRWPAFKFDDERPDTHLVPGYVWTRCEVKIVGDGAQG
jgi:hypothetical protein